MSRATSPATGRAYGVERVCTAWDLPRSSFYAGRTPPADETLKPAPARRGPKPAIADADLLAAIRADLAASPFQGEGHRKVWARLRIQKDIGVARKRVLRLMRENHLLSPHRGRQAPPNRHEGTDHH
ncbi:MAG TPA: IS3 family transposase [Isosphaeraceae bacterium]|nr:IS3 family transposase [Isosphaeraceae bacterium]